MERIDDLNIKGLKLVQNTDYFLFGMDSVLLANLIESKASDVIVDLGTGSAVIPILLTAKTKCKKILGIELQQEMYNLAIKNVGLNKLEDKIQIIKEDIKNTSNIQKWLAKEMGKDKVDIIVSNPPYKKEGTGTVNDGSVKYIARHEAQCKLEDIFSTASSLLKFKGKLYLVHKPERLVDLIAVARQYNLEAKRIRFLQPTIDKKPSIVLIQYVLGGGNECTVDSAIIEYDEQGNYTKDITYMYSKEVESNESK